MPMFVVPFALACTLALLLTPAGIRLAWATGYLDHPEARKLHLSATALLGGVVVFVAAIAGWLAALATRSSGTESEVFYLISGAAIALLWGLWDDRFGMGVALKLAGQVAAAATLLASGNVPDLGLPPPFNAVVTVLALVALMNAINFLDNMNGMVAGLAAIVLAFFAWTSIARGAFGLAAAQLALAGACVGFLRYNFPRARIFLGDAGSLFLGYSLGASAVLALVHAPEGWGRVGLMFGLAYPAFDIVFVVLNRLRDGRKVHQGGRDHSNHRLASVLGCQKRTVILLWCSTAALCASGLAVQRLNHPIPALLLSVLWLAPFLWAGTRLSSVPIAATHPPLARS
jgi:UDP-GlcNAc:undecaprenyl-phosphate GlcNAc-1-phosphate transferase